MCVCVCVCVCACVCVCVCACVHGSVDVVQDFTYLGANISRDGEITSEVTRRIARASREGASI